MMYSETLTNDAELQILTCQNANDVDAVGTSGRADRRKGVATVAFAVFVLVIVMIFLASMPDALFASWISRIGHAHPHRGSMDLLVGDQILRSNSTAALFGPPPSQATTLFPQVVCDWIASDTCVDQTEAACHCRQINPYGPCTPCPNSILKAAKKADLTTTTAAPTAAPGPALFVPWAGAVATVDDQTTTKAAPKAAAAGSDLTTIKAAPKAAATGNDLTTTKAAPKAAATANDLKTHEAPEGKELSQDGEHRGSKPAWASRRGSILVIGDWGFDFGCHGNSGTVACQQLIANKMLEEMNLLKDVKFVVNVGDSFYPHGVKSKSDPQWASKWREVFSPKLRSVPWYSVYGNHDLQYDPCGCSEDPAVCAQINSNISDRDFFYMPDHNWYRMHPELDLEVIGLDMNHYMQGYDRSKSAEEQYFEDCAFQPCVQYCVEIMKRRSEAAIQLFQDRSRDSTAKNLLVFSHYPTDYFTSAPGFLAGLRDQTKHHILYLGGHRHNVDQTSTESTYPNTNWLVGGGGGWSCDGPQQGFLVIEIQEDYSLNSYPVLVDTEVCCPSTMPSPPWKGFECAWHGCDVCSLHDEQSCKCREMNPDGPCTPCPNSQPTGMVCSGKECSPR